MGIFVILKLCPIRDKISFRESWLIVNLDEDDARRAARA